MRNSKGTSLVSVIIAFLILMIIMTLFLQTVNLSSRMVARAVEIRKAYNSLTENYYKDPDGAAVEAAGTGVFMQGNSQCFTLDMTLKSYTDPEYGGKYYFFDDSDQDSGGQ